MIPKKAQYSLEYIMIFGIALAVLVPAVFFFFNMSATSQEQILFSQINNVGQHVMNSVRTVYYAGEFSKDFIDVKLPPEFVNLTIFDNRELVFYFNTRLGVESLVLWSDINITSNIIKGEGVWLVTPSTFQGGFARLRLEAITTNDVDQVILSLVT